MPTKKELLEDYNKLLESCSGTTETIIQLTKTIELQLKTIDIFHASMTRKNKIIDILLGQLNKNN